MSRRVPTNHIIRRIRMDGGQVMTKVVPLNNRRNIYEPKTNTEVIANDYSKEKEAVKEIPKKAGGKPVVEKPSLIMVDNPESKATRADVLKAIHKALSENESPKRGRGQQQGGMIRRLV